MSGYLLDTHVWIWLLAGDEALKPKHRTRLDEARQSSEAFVSAISVWEIARKQSDDDLELGVDVETWLRVSQNEGRLRLLDLAVPILIQSTRLPAKVHGDPADRMLMATAIHHDLTLVTHDGHILRNADEAGVRVHKV